MGLTSRNSTPWSRWARTFCLRIIIEWLMIIETMSTFIRSQEDKRHCFMKVPCLEIDGLVLTQSVAIMEYLADR